MNYNDYSVRISEIKIETTRRKRGAQVRHINTLTILDRIHTKYHYKCHNNNIISINNSQQPFRSLRTIVRADENGWLDSTSTPAHRQHSAFQITHCSIQSNARKPNYYCNFCFCSYFTPLSLYAVDGCYYCCTTDRQTEHRRVRQSEREENTRTERNMKKNARALTLSILICIVFSVLFSPLVTIFCSL